MGPVLQRGKNDKWALAAVKKQRKLLDSKSLWGEGALHHHISRERLSSLDDELKKSLKSRSRNIKTAAQGFLALVKAIIEDMLVEFDETKRKEGVKRNDAKSTISRLGSDTLLYNMSLNLHYGPSIVANDPGSRFDPTTVEGDDAREIETVSADLLALDTYCQAALEGLDEGDELTENQWLAITQLLSTAYESYRSRDVGVFEADYDEQWVQGAGDAWMKKGDLHFRDEEYARTMFGAPTPQVNQSANPETTKTFQVACAGGQQDVTIGATFKSVTHFCNRHTYAYFDTAQIKGVNIFWPTGTGRPQVVGYANDAIDAAWAFILAGIDDPQTIEDYLLETAITDFVGGGGTKKAVDDLYFRVFLRNARWNANTDVSLELDMVAPTGSTYDAYSYDVLHNVLF